MFVESGHRKSLTPEELNVSLNSEAKDSRDISLLRSENSGVPRYYKHRTPSECPPRISSPRLLVLCRQML
jgi:hypothetical protein